METYQTIKCSLIEYQWPDILVGEFFVQSYRAAEKIENNQHKMKTDRGTMYVRLVGKKMKIGVGKKDT